mmetsp:Transcript_46647/g.116871  ORF Transcript_46647/g.116871 Transcript_46647/m.116871 type:complete len:368 (-) Transcript_46647:362-1465(-)
MPHAVGEEGRGLGQQALVPVGGVCKGQGPLQPHVPRFLDGLDLEDGARGLGGEGRDLALPVHLGGGPVRVPDGREARDDHLLERVEALLAEDAEGHLVGRVVLGVEGEELAPQVDVLGLGVLLEGELVAGTKLGVGVLLVAAQLQDLVAAPQVGLEVLGVLALDGVELAARGGRREEGGDEELAEDVERGLQGVLVDAKVVVCVLGAREGVGGPPVDAQKLLKVSLLRVLLRAEKQHVLAKVRHARDLVGVRVVTDVHVERGRRLVGHGVRREQHAQAVGEGEGAVRPPVLGRLLHLPVLPHDQLAGRLADPLPEGVLHGWLPRHLRRRLPLGEEGGPRGGRGHAERGSPGEEQLQRVIGVGGRLVL